MNWERITCGECGYSDYDDDDDLGTVERTENGPRCAGCRVNEMLDYDESGGYYE